MIWEVDVGIEIDNISSEIDFSNNVVNIINAVGYVNNSPILVKGKFDKDPSEMRKAPGYYDSVPGVNTPEIRIPENKKNDNVSVPAFNPPVPNRAWTAMKQGLDIEELSESEKRDLYVGRDRYF